MLLGLALGLGTTKLVAISFGITLFYVIYYRKRFRIPLQVWIICGIVLLTAAWSVKPDKPFLQVCAILLGVIAFQTLPRNGWKWGLAAVIAIQLGIAAYEYSTGYERIFGLSRNASVIGLSGLYGSPFILSAILNGVSLSRTALGGSVLLAILYRQRRYIISALIVVSISVTLGLIVTPDRYTLPRIEQDNDRRISAITGNSPETLSTTNPHYVVPVDRREWRWYGYGYGNYYFATGQIQPHNILVRAWFELGIFSIPLGITTLWLWWRSRLGWRFLVLCLAVGMFTDELFGSVEGIYMILTFAIMNASPGTLPTYGKDRQQSWLGKMSLRGL